MAAYLLHSAFLEFHVDDVHHHRCSVLFVPPHLEWKRNLIYFPGDTQVSPAAIGNVNSPPPTYVFTLHLGCSGPGTLVRTAPC